MSLPIPDSERTQAATPEQERVSALRSATEMFPDGYEKHEIVGQGGMGIVYRARDVAVDRDIAIKLLQPHFAADSAEARRFVEEARISAQLQDPGIPAIHEVGTMANDRPFIAMKLIKGETLDWLLKRPDDRNATGCDRNASKRDRFASLCARCKSRVTSDRLRFFDCANSCG